MKNLKNKISRSFRRHKKEWALSLLTIVGGGVLVAAVVIKTTDKPIANANTTAITKKPVAPQVVPTSTLSGLPISDAAVNQKPVTGVMIENSLQARPQSGLSQAGVVFEAIAEGGVTRFLALFQDTTPESVGPVRSARPYFQQWALGFDAGYAHVGGSPEANANVKTWGIRDLDQFYNSSAYQRVSGRASPHNVYTNIASLQQIAGAKGYTTSTYTPLARKSDAPSKSPTAKSINLNISGANYNVRYDYDAAKNSYNRSVGGAAHIDANTNTQLSPKVVIALIMPYSIQRDGIHSVYSTIGTGSAVIFQDGIATQANWTKVDNKSQFSFSDATGKPISLNPGQTWLTALGDASRVNFTP